MDSFPPVTELQELPPQSPREREGAGICVFEMVGRHGNDPCSVG